MLEMKNCRIEPGLQFRTDALKRYFFHNIFFFCFVHLHMYLNDVLTFFSRENRDFVVVFVCVFVLIMTHRDFYYTHFRCISTVYRTRNCFAKLNLNFCNIQYITTVPPSIKFKNFIFFIDKNFKSQHTPKNPFQLEYRQTKLFCLYFL